ncbi:MAG: type II secretion system protein [Phycisphaerales bacterium]
MRGFTLIELSIVLVIIAIMATLAFFVFGRAIRGGRESGERLYLNSLKVSVEYFKQDHGFLPPLVNDNINAAGEFRLDSPIDRTTQQPLVRDRAFLQGLNNPGAPRWSVFSLTFYICGVLGADQDGVEGPGFTKPLDDGRFSRSGRKYDAYFDSGRDPTRVRRNPTATLGQTEVVLVDRWGKGAARASWLPNNTIRYYRWEPRFYPAGTPNAGKVQNYNVPKVVGLPNANEELRNSGFAIVSKGPDGSINDSTPTAAANADNLVEVGR